MQLIFLQRPASIDRLSQLRATAGTACEFVETSKTPEPGQIWLDPDALWPEGWLVRTLSAIARAPDATGVLTCLSDAQPGAHPCGGRLIAQSATDVDQHCQSFGHDGYWPIANNPLAMSKAPLLAYPFGWQATATPVWLWTGMFVATGRAPEAGADSIAVPWFEQFAHLSQWPRTQPLPRLDRPVVLHVLHGWGGGAETWVRNFARSDAGRCHLILQAVREGLDHGARLRLAMADEPEAVLAESPLQPAISATAQSHSHYRSTVRQWLQRWQVRSVWISSLIGHALDILDLALALAPDDDTTQGAPLVWITHDYYPLWPQLHADFGNPQSAFDQAALHRIADDAGCLRCEPFGHINASAWWVLRTAVLARLGRAHFVSPSISAAENWQRLAPELRPATWRVIPHGADWPSLPDSSHGKPAIHPRLRVLVPGRINGAKGADLLRKAMPALVEHAELWLLGCGSGGLSLLGLNHVHVISDYEPAALAGWVSRIAPDLALLPRTVAETYSYTLSECWALGLPVLATRLGSLAERVEHGINGWLVEPSPAALIQAVANLAQDRSMLAAVRPGTLVSAQDMLDAYRPLLPTELPVVEPETAHAAIPGPEQIRLGLLSARLDDLEKTLGERERALELAQVELARRGEWGHEQAHLAEQRTTWARSLVEMLDHEREAARRAEDSFSSERAQLLDHITQAQEALRDKHARFSAELARVNAELQAVYASTSWRVTRPLRALGHRMLGIRSRLALRVRTLRSLLSRAWHSLRQRGLRATLDRALRWFRPPVPVPLSIQTEALPDAGASFIPFALPRHPQPTVSIIIPVYNKWRYTEACLRSLARLEDACSFEAIVVDDGSSDETAERLASIDGVIAEKNPENLGFIGACNRGLELARGRFVFFLNNDTQVQPGCLDALLACFEAHSDAGLVGSKLIYPDGRLQECGGIVFSDGSGWNYGRFEDPEDPRFKFLREVDYVSGAAIMLPTPLARQLGGFDALYAPAYYEDTDLAFRVRALGLKVFVQPRSRVVHFEGITGGTDLNQGAKRFQVVNQVKFHQRWQQTLSAHGTPPPATPIERSRHHRKLRHVLVIDACTPMPDQDAGSVRMFEWLKLMVEDGCAVTFFAENCAYHAGYVEALQDLGVEMLYHPYLSDSASFLATHAARFELIILSRYYVVEQFLPLIRRHAPKAKVWFDTVDLHYLRERREADLGSDPALFRKAAATKRRELAMMRAVDLTLVVSPVEQDLLANDCPEAAVGIIPTIQAVPGRRRDFDQRADLFFVGGFQHPPNRDAVLWFAQNVWPLVRARLPQARWHIVGSKTPPEVLSLANESIVVHGFLPSLDALLDGCRLSVAPLRFGAGVKGKINVSMSYGCPVVATELAIEGMHLIADRDVLVASQAEDFAEAVVRLYQDQELWQRLSDAGIANVEGHFSPAAARRMWQALCQTASIPSLPAAASAEGHAPP